MELLYNGETVHTISFSEYGGECVETGTENVIWLYFISTDNNVTNLQYRPHERGF